MRTAAKMIEANGTEANRNMLVMLLESLLAKQFSLVEPEALAGRARFRARETRVRASHRACPSKPVHLQCCQMVEVPEEQPHWTVKLPTFSGPCFSCVGNSTWKAVETQFSIWNSQPHTSTSVVRLMQRWQLAEQRAPAIFAAATNGFVFSCLTGLTATHHFSERELSMHGIVSVLTHRMILHMAASEHWRLFRASICPPKGFKEGSHLRIDQADFGAYRAFFRPLRSHFVELQPFLPVICIAWGENAKKALLSLPYTVEPDRGQDVEAREGLSATKLAEGSPGVTRSITSFENVAEQNLLNLQLMDSVEFDPLTGRAVFPMYLSAKESPDEVNVLLLDAARGMQCVACPVQPRDLRRVAF